MWHLQVLHALPKQQHSALVGALGVAVAVMKRPRNFGDLAPVAPQFDPQSFVIFDPLRMSFLDRAMCKFLDQPAKIAAARLWHAASRALIGATRPSLPVWGR